jgi:hypothetical protein
LKQRNAYKSLVGKPEAKRPLGSSSRRWKYNIRMKLEEIVNKDVGWIRLPQDWDQLWSIVNMAMKFSTL